MMFRVEVRIAFDVVHLLFPILGEQYPTQPGVQENVSQESLPPPHTACSKRSFFFFGQKDIISMIIIGIKSIKHHTSA